MLGLMEIDDDYENQFEEEEQDISQEDAWTIISAYFEDKGLVCQQLDSFEEFIQNTMQETVDELCSASTKISDQSLQIFGCQSDTKRKRDRSDGECSVSLLLLFAQFMSEEEAFRLERFSLPAISHSQNENWVCNEGEALQCLEDCRWAHESFSCLDIAVKLW